MTDKQTERERDRRKATDRQTDGQRKRWKESDSKKERKTDINEIEGN